MNESTEPTEIRRPRRRRAQNTEESDNKDNESIPSVQPRPRRQIRSRSQPNADPLGSTGELNKEASDLGSTELTAENRPKRPKKRRSRPPPEGQDADVPTESTPKIIYIGVAEALKDLEDDIEPPRQDDSRFGSQISQAPTNLGGDATRESNQTLPGATGLGTRNLTAPTVGMGRPSDIRLMNSQKGNQIYIEERSRFRAEDKEQYEKRVITERYQLSHEDESNIIRDENDALNFAVSLHRGFLYIGICVHGFLCGFSILHTVYIWSLTTKNFLSIYAPSARAFSIVFYILIAVSCVSASDRIDYGHFTHRALAKSRRYAYLWFLLVLMFVCIIINGVMYPNENHFYNYQLNSTYVPVDFSTQFTVWRSLDIVRTVLLALAWFIVAYDPITDQLTTNLRSSMTEILNTDDDGSEMAIVNGNIA